MLLRKFHAAGALHHSTSAASTPVELAGTGFSTFAFPTTITNALGQTLTRKYDYYTGKVVDAGDVNGVVTSLYYSNNNNDPLDRLSQAISGASLSQAAPAASTAFGYDDVNRIVTVNADQSAYGAGGIETQTVFDGLGRKNESRVYTANGYLSTTTSYDAMGRVFGRAT